jgi:peptide-methionine (S)-S-oxide reductase
VFFLIHDPTTLNRQGNDIGTQYRSAIFCINEKDINICNDYIKNLGEKMIFNSNIVTSVEKLNKFYLAEIEHKDYYNLNKNQPYCSAVIGPKVKKFINNKPKLIK